MDAQLADWNGERGHLAHCSRHSVANSPVFGSMNKIMRLRVAEIPSGNMPDGASRMLALPEQVLYERDHYPQRARDRSRQ